MNANEIRTQNCRIKHDPLVTKFLESGCDSLYAYCTEQGYSSVLYNTLYKYIKKYRKDIILSASKNGKSKRRQIHLDLRRKHIPSKEVLCELYLIQKKHMGIIANQFGVSMPTVCRWFKKYEIPARSTSEVNKLLMTDEKREHFRKLANSGKTGVFKSNKKWNNGSPTWIEVALMEWLDVNNIRYKFQWQFEPSTHRYDFRLLDHQILIETDGLYFHDRPKQKQKDKRQEQDATDRGFKVIRFTDKQIKKTNKKCFEVILDEIQHK